jgi:hypothetical protein
MSLLEAGLFLFLITVVPGAVLYLLHRSGRVTIFKAIGQMTFFQTAQDRVRQFLLDRIFIEILLLTLWGIWVARVFIDFDPTVWPAGGEWGMSLQPYHFWENLRECGACALWNGGINGGRPALADFFGSLLHPLASIPIFLLGVSNGMKIAMVLACIAIALGQWWIAKEMNLGWQARMYTGALAAISGPIIQPLEAGEPELILSAAGGTITLAAALRLLRKKDRRSSLILALAGAQFILTGHGYHQFAFLWWALPFALFLLIDYRAWKVDPIWKEFARAVGFSAAISGLLLIPFIHFLPNFSKHVDPLFGTGQTFEYLPLNLVIRDWEFLHTAILGKLPFTTPLYVGWIPIILAALCLRFARREDQRLLLALGTGSLLILFVASGEPMRWLVEYIPFIGGLRFIVLAGGMAIPGILALAAYGLDGLTRLDWLTVTLHSRSDARAWSISFAWILIFPLMWSLSTSYEVSRSYFRTNQIVNQYKIWRAIKNTNAQWISPPFGNHYWIEPAMASGLKLTEVVFPFNWKDRSMPQRKQALTDTAAPDDAQVIDQFNEYFLHEYPRGDYAYVKNLQDEYAPCSATAQSGFIDVVCNAPFDGTLIVEENNASGWTAWVDDRAVGLDDLHQRLALDLPKGKHTIRLRFYPLDAWIGLIVSALGIGLWIGQWRKSGERNSI